MRSASTTRSRTISADTLKRALDAGQPVRVLDVRSEDEYAEWHIPGSVNLPLPRVVAGERPDVPRDAQIVTVCLHGTRSEKARAVLGEAGFDVRSLEGGMVAWNTVFDVAELRVGSARIHQMRRIAKGCVSYVIASRGQALVVDATLDVEAYQEEAAKLEASIVAVLDTHAHADHASGGRRLAEAVGATYRAPAEAGLGVEEGAVEDGLEIPFGEATLRARATPGHTPGSMTYLLDDVALTGDTLFVESVGRPDLGQDPRSNGRILWRTLHERVLALPDRTRILPGHYGESVALQPGEALSATLGALRGRIRALDLSEDEFVEWAAGNALPQPGNFDAIKRYNQGKLDVELAELRDLEAGPNRCAIA